jgi:hypothetical protein
LFASWTWAWILSFLQWFTDYMELSCMDLSMELINCVIGGFQMSVAGIFHEALVDVAVDPQAHMTDAKWTHYGVEYDTDGWWNYDPILPTRRLVPSFVIDFNGIFTLLRHVFCYPTLEEIHAHIGANPEDVTFRAKYGIYFDDDVDRYLPPWEDNAGCLLVGFGRHEWDDGTWGQVIWDGIGQVLMWSFGACVSVAFTAGGGFFCGLVGVLGSLVANEVASFLIQQLLYWAAQGILVSIVVEIIFQSVVDADQQAAEPYPQSEPGCSQVNRRYTAWAR